MKKVFLGLVAIILLAALFIFVNKLYYPKSPIDHLSAKEILDTLDYSKEDVVMLAIEDDWTWYITRSDNNGILGTDEKIKKMVSSNGWNFKEKDGSGLFFEKDDERLIVTTEMWTSKYVLVKVPDNFNN